MTRENGLGCRIITIPVETEVIKSHITSNSSYHNLWIVQWVDSQLILVSIHPLFVGVEG